LIRDYERIKRNFRPYILQNLIITETLQPYTNLSTNSLVWTVLSIPKVIPPPIKHTQNLEKSDPHLNIVRISKGEEQSGKTLFPVVRSSQTDH